MCVYGRVYVFVGVCMHVLSVCVGGFAVPETGFKLHHAASAMGENTHRMSSQVLFPHHKLHWNVIFLCSSLASNFFPLNC